MRKLNSYAADMIPIRLIVSIAIISAIMVMFAFAYTNLRINLSEGSIESDLEYLESSLLNVIASGVTRDVDEVDASDGTKRLISFDVPDNVIYISFGVDPDINNNQVLKSGLFESGNNIFYRVSGGSKKVIWLDSEYKFREGIFSNDKWTINNPSQGYIIRSPGKYDIVFEFVERFNEKYILILENDNIS